MTADAFADDIKNCLDCGIDVKKVLRFLRSVQNKGE